jgi:hypothetical protein
MAEQHWASGWGKLKHKSLEAELEDKFDTIASEIAFIASEDGQWDF